MVLTSVLVFINRYSVEGAIFSLLDISKADLSKEISLYMCKISS
jgi:hypothetical protein